MRELTLGQPVSDEDFERWVKDSLYEIELASREYSGEGSAAVAGSAGTANPLVNGTAAPGTAALWSREDHVHPTDTSRAPLDSPTFTGNPTAPTPSGGDDDTSIATTEWVNDTIAAAISGLAADSVRYGTVQSLTAAEKAQARANIDALKKNYVINGAMMVSQENGTTAGTTTGYYPVDQFFAAFSNGGTLSVAQVASATPAGSPNRTRVTVTSADASVAAGDYLYLATRIEGLRSVDLLIGTASAKTVILQFGVKAPAGTYCVVFLNSALNRSYVGEYTISGGEANTDVVKTVSLNLDTSGTWLATNGIGLEIRWSLMAGSTYQQAAGSWSTGNAVGSSNQFNFMGTNSNVFELFDVGLYEGAAAPSFQVPELITEKLLCNRYYYKIAPGVNAAGIAAGLAYTASLGIFDWTFPVEMRSTPTCSINALNIVSASSVQAASSISASTTSPTGVELQLNSSSLTVGGAVLRTSSTSGYVAFNARL